MKEKINQKLDKFYEHGFIAVPITIAVTFIGWNLLPKLGGSSQMLRYIIALIYGLAVYWGFRWFRKGHVYSCGLKKHGLKNLWVSLPLLLINLFDFLKPINTFGAELLNGRLLLFAFILSLEAGVSEELLMRALPLENVLCRAKTRKQYLGLVFMTSFFFGVMHIKNYFWGDDLGMVLAQIINAGCAGVFYAALYLRTGSIIPSVVLHTLWDFSRFLDPALVADGIAEVPLMEISAEQLSQLPPEIVPFLPVMIGALSSVLGVVWVIGGMFLLRRSKWEEIKANFTAPRASE